ncbi:filamentous hemagglutinin N-terminal domain-containing protein [Duganella sp. BJB1802]|uniref:YDG domain-containing protein n=1 Tax=Duganella sp. BJB1802 TaxID=2744575 RepID=UPI00159396B7|nr:YDG domain-containing protein [Duganella sp. BJB1802]NVD72817.1 filamentous hemagglutinin N-terminal domain-containing protein [Duganella sp. BJB1802]
MKADTSRSTQRRAQAAPLRRKLIAVMVAACYSSAQAGPSNPTVVAGQASFNLQGKTYSITNTPNTIINWQSFSVAPDEITRFIQQSADSKVLNRITGQNPTQILGSLQSNGKVFLINPNGVIFGAGSRVDVNGLVASSLAISNADFLAGKNNFSGDATVGKVSNAGTITTPSGGQIFLVAPAVENSGVISAPNGDVVLAAGHSVQLFDSKDPNVQVVVSAPADQALNLGQIVAQGGRVGVYGALVNQRGGINANSAVRGANGQIILKASGTTLLEAGSTTTATGSNLATGGDIRLLGDRVGLTGNAVVDASGAAGGGTVLVGGDYQGKNAAVQNAQQSYVGKDSVIRADATANGDGGKVIVWSDQATQMFGAISARGGANGGNGGFVETSGHYLNMQGTVDTLAPKGATGKLLLDPSDVYIADNSGVSGVPSSVGNLNLVTGGTTFLESGSVQDSLLLTGTLHTALLANNVTVSTGNPNGSGGGDISVLSQILLPSGRTLSLTADRDINLKAPITGGNSDLVLTSGRSIVQVTEPIAALTVHNINAMAVTNITLANDGNDIGGYASLQATNGNVLLTGTSVNLANSLAGGTLTATAQNGDLRVSGNVTSTGNMTLTSAKTNGLATVDSGMSVLSSSGNVVVQADNMTLNGTLSAAATHGVRLTPYSDATAIQVGAGATDAAGVLGLSDTELKHVQLPNNGWLSIGDAAGGSGYGSGTGNLSVVGNLDLTGGQNAGTLTLFSQGGNISVASGAAVKNTGALSLITHPSGDYRITNAGSLTSSSGINLYAGKMTLAGGTLNSSSVSLGSTNAVDIGATGNPSNTLALTNADLASANTSWLTIDNNNQSAAGNIVVSQPLTLTNSLALTATGNIAMQAAVTTGGLALRAGTSSSISATGNVTVNGIFNLQAGNWNQVGSLPSFSATDFRIAGGSFVRAASGDGAMTPYHLVDVYGLQGMASLPTTYLYTLDNDIDASQTAHWNSMGGSNYQGFKPIGDLDHAYAGTFDGNHKSISGLYINLPTTNQIGLFSVLGSGTIRDLRIAGATVEGNSYTGVLAGSIQMGGTVSGVAIESNVYGNGTNLGGLAGYSNGAIGTSYVVGNVIGKNAYSVGSTGGLLGGNGMYGTLNTTYSSGDVKTSTNDVVHALVGAGAGGGAVTHSYYSAAGAGSDSAGAAGLTSTQMMQQASFSGFDFTGGTSVWRIYAGHTTPLLRGFLTPLTVNVTGTGGTKIYDGAAAAFGQTYTHADVSGTLGFDGAINTGTYNLGGLYSHRYDISYDAAPQMVITPRHITATVTGASKTYDRLTDLVLGTSDGVYDFSYGNVVGTDKPGISGTLSFADKTAGTGKTVTVASASLTNNPNNNYVLDGAVTGSGTINKAKLQISGLSAPGRTYDGTTDITVNGTASVTPISGDAVTLSGSNSAKLQNKNAGASKLVLLDLNNYSLSGDDAGNYMLVSPSSLMTEIAPAQLSVSGVTANSRVYNMNWNPAASQYGTGATLNVAGGTLGGVIGGDVVTLSAGSGTFSDRNVGTGKSVTANGFVLGGADGGNYVVTGLPTGLTANITPAPLTLTLLSRQYDNTTNATYSGATLSGVLGMPEGPLDAVSLLIGEGSTLSYADKNVGVNKVVNITGAQPGITGSASGNYTLNAGARGTITARPTSTWNGSGGGLWSAAGNWTDSIAPDGANVLAAVIGSSAGTITYDASAGNVKLNALTVGSGSQLALTAGTLIVNGTSDLSSATLTLNGGNLVQNGAMTVANLALTNGVLSGTNSAANLTAYNLTQTSNGSIDTSGSLNVYSNGNLSIGNARAQSGITLVAGEGSGAISQTGALQTDSLHAFATNGIALTNTGNHVNAFAASNGHGNIALTNTVSSGELALGALTTTNGNIVIDNHGGIHTGGAIHAYNGGVSITAHSPITISDQVAGDDIALSASTDITLLSGSQLNATNTIKMTATNNIVLGGLLSVTSPTGSISALSTNGSISVGSATTINSNGAPVSLAAPFGSVSAGSISLGSGTVPVIDSGSYRRSVAADAAAKAAADAIAAPQPTPPCQGRRRCGRHAAADAAARRRRWRRRLRRRRRQGSSRCRRQGRRRRGPPQQQPTPPPAAADAAAQAAADAAARAAAEALPRQRPDAAAAKAAAMPPLLPRWKRRRPGRRRRPRKP